MVQTGYLEDFAVGQVHNTGSIEVTRADAIAFASRYDPQPMHTDEEAARRGNFGGLIASGWHTAALVMRLIVDSHPLGEAPILGLGVDELRWPEPVHPGDIIQAETEVVSITPSRSKPEYGVVRLKVTARNQRDLDGRRMPPACRRRAGGPGNLSVLQTLSRLKCKPPAGCLLLPGGQKARNHMDTAT